MEETLKQEKSSNLFLDFFKAWLYIFLYALRGVKYITVDLWVIIFNYFSFRVDKTYQKVTKGSNQSEEVVEDMSASIETETFR